MSAIPNMTPAAPQPGGTLIVSPDHALRRRVLERLQGRARVQESSGGAEALSQLETGRWHTMFLDRRLPDLNADELLAIIQRRFPEMDVVLLDPDAPAGRDPNSRIQPAQSVAAATGAAREIPDPMLTEPLPGMIGASEPMRQVYRLVRLVAPRPTTVLIAGPTGTGKELVARALHALSPRASKPLVVVNCAAIPEALLESELFGHTRGAFTGAVQSQMGRIAAAHGGTLFLDEVGELPLGMQAKLLRFLEQKEIQRLGATETTRVDVRVVAASNLALATHAARGEFRLDLFYRLSAFPIELPPLRDRRADICPLARHFLECMAAAMAMPPPQLTCEAAQALESHSWRGNVRELQHVMERASILAGNEKTIEVSHLYFSEVRSSEPRSGEPPRLVRLESL